MKSASSLRSLYAQEVRERGFREDPAQLAALDRLDDLRRRLIAQRRVRPGLPQRLLWKLAVPAPPPAPRGIYLWGRVGRGKTFLMDLFYRSLPFEQKRRRHFHRFMHDVHAELKGMKRTSAPLAAIGARLARDTRVLCFDELYVSDIADAMILGKLFEALFDHGLTLVVTSNVAPRDLYKGGLQRQRFLPAIDLLERHTEVVAVDGNVDYRLRQLTQAGTYLQAGAADTPARLEALFHELADGGEQRGGSIEINGRQLPVVRASDTAVWFEFAALCEGPRSQNDYIEIARDYQSVFVSNVPVLDALREDPARRFIALVDELYDRRVNLVLSAQAPPAQLYRGERLVREFERTASRLVEMQSAEYLARPHLA